MLYLLVIFFCNLITAISQIDTISKTASSELLKPNSKYQDWSEVPYASNTNWYNKTLPKKRQIQYFKTHNIDN